MIAPLADIHLAEPWWIGVLKTLVIFAIGLTLVPVGVLFDRKVMARMQNRYGPNRVGPFGVLTPVADVFKLLAKKDFRPRTATGWLFALAPIIALTTAVGTLAIVPWGTDVNIFGTQVGLYGIDVSIGLLYLLAVGSLGFYGILLGGWASGSKYAYLGGMRGAAQLISYEISQGLALMGVVLMVGSLSLVDIVDYQAHHLWLFIPQALGFVIFLVSAFAETGRPPFDQVEADSELVQGFMTEYGGGPFATFYFAEYLHMVVASAILTTVYTGGWHIPFVGDVPGILQPLVVIVKILLWMVFFVWARATLPRLRYDQVMSLGWKVMLPLAMLNTVVTAILVVVI